MEQQHLRQEKKYRQCTCDGDKATPFGVQFSAYQAFYYAADGLAAGTYNITIGADWGNNCKKGTTYQFTLTKDVPAGGQLAGLRGAPDNTPDKWRVYSYESNAAIEALETVTLAEGNGGTSLGILITAGNDAENLNSLQRTA